MAEYRISQMADEHIAAIAEYTDETFGEKKTEAYLAGLKASFALIAQFPHMGIAAFEIKQGWRRHKYQRHHIFYSEQASHVLIEAVVHMAKSIRAELFE